MSDKVIFIGGAGSGLTPAGSNGDIQTKNGSSLGSITPATGIATMLATPTSANVAAAVTDETGTGALVFGTNPTLTGYTLTGAAVSTPTAMASPPTVDVTLPWITRSISAPETLAFSNATPTIGTSFKLTYTADSTNRVITFPASVYSYDQQAVSASTTITASTSKTLIFVKETSRWAVYGDGVPTTGTGSYVLATSPALVTPVLGTPTSGNLANCTATTQAAGSADTKLATDAYADNNSTLTYNAQSGTTYTLVLADGKPGSSTSGVSMTNAAAMTLTVPTNASVAFPTGWMIPILNLGAAALTIAPAGGVTLNAPNLTLGVNASGVLHKTATNTWQFYSQGLPALVGYGRFTAQAAAKASVATFTVGAADSSFTVWANVLITTSTTYTFTVTCAYTDEGNTSRTLTLNFSNVGGTLATSIANAGGAVPYEGLAMNIRCKTATSITIASAAGGTYTAVAYNIEGFIQQTN